MDVLMVGSTASRIGRGCACLILLLMSTGCQVGTPTVSNSALLAHLPGVDFSGLKPVQPVDPIKVDCSVPSRWKTLRLDHNALYTHQQWKSQTGYTGAGVAYIHLPIPLSAKAVLWFAKMEYTKKGPTTGKALGEWTDELGRPWFEAENEKYHVRGYAVTNGFSAWIVYYGYKVQRPLEPAELSLAQRCVDTVVPWTGESRPSSLNLANVGKSDPQKKG